MAVYQSVTEPEVRRKTYQEVVSGHIIDSVGKRKVIKWMRGSGKVPAKVEPSERLVYGGWEFRFEWFEVETFN